MSKKLNDICGFVGASDKGDGYFKVKVQNESFWLRNCEKDESGIWHGIVDNSLLNTEFHGLDYNDRVIFELIE